MVLNFFKKNKKAANLEILAPVNGEIIPIEEVPDPVFSQKMMGEGFAMVPTDGRFLSPVKGKVIQVSPTKHAVGILADDGTEILMHIGLETVALAGKGFTVEVAVDDQVSVGQLLIDVDLDYISTNAKSIITPVVITNSLNSDKKYIVTAETKGEAGSTVVLTVSAS